MSLMNARSDALEQCEANALLTVVRGDQLHNLQDL
jgi:hypothetical protein